MGNSAVKTGPLNSFSDKKQILKTIQKMASNGELNGAGSAGLVSQWVDKVTRFSSEYDSQRCDCNHCIHMPTLNERRCCKRTHIVDQKCDGLPCITHHEGFQANCLNIHVLEASYYDYVIDHGQREEDQPIHDWPASVVVGEPRVYPQYGDVAGAWAPGVIDAEQFLEFEYKEKVYIVGIDIYETYHAGGVVAVKALNDRGEWKTLWKADRPTDIKESRIFKPKLAEIGCQSRNIRLDIDCTACNTWVEIDAVQLHGRKCITEPPPGLENLATDLAQLVGDSRFSDIQFKIQGDFTVHAHKAILCARSDYFKAMFSDLYSHKESKMEVVTIKDVSYDSFMAVLHFIYTNGLPDYDTIKLTDVWRVADRFSMDGLKKLSAYLINLKINENNVVDTYVATSSALPVIEEVKKNCMLYMSCNMSKIVKTSSFTSLPQETMLEIIQGATAGLSLE